MEQNGVKPQWSHKNTKDAWEKITEAARVGRGEVGGEAARAALLKVLVALRTKIIGIKMKLSCKK